MKYQYAKVMGQLQKLVEKKKSSKQEKRSHAKDW